MKKLIFGKSFGISHCKTQGYLTKKNYRFLDIKRKFYPGAPATILQSNVYDPNRSATISLIIFPNGMLTYVLAAQFSSTQTQIYNLHPSPLLHDKGWSNFLRFTPTGTMIYNIEIIPGKGVQLIRSAGIFALTLRHQKHHTLIKLKSGANHFINSNSIVSIGSVSNPNHFLRNLKKAGTTRNLGIRPHTRAASKNPVDHPMGGRTRGGIIPQNKNGKIQFRKTSNPHKYHNMELVSSRKAKLKK